MLEEMLDDSWLPCDVPTEAEVDWAYDAIHYIPQVMSEDEGKANLVRMITAARSCVRRFNATDATMAAVNCGMLPLEETPGITGFQVETFAAVRVRTIGTIRGMLP